MHCFTRGPNSSKNEYLNDVAPELLYRDSRETRIFCFKRYELSKKLPCIAKEIYKARCFHTGRNNFFTVSLVDADGERQDYEVYFKVSKANKDGVLRLYVQSAYVRDDAYTSSQPNKKKIKFFTIAYNTQAGKLIKVPT